MVRETLGGLHQKWHQEWHEKWVAADGRQRDRMVADVLGVSVADDALPHYTTSLQDAQQAMDRAWVLMEEAAPVRISCHVALAGAEGRKQCHVEWWPADGDHLTTPTFTTEAESRAFAAFVFASLLGKV